MTSPENVRAFRRSLLRWFRRNGRDLPWRHTRDPYAILVSEVMLQQTQVATVIPYYEKWLPRFPDFAALAAASEDEVLHAWQGLGYYNRARNLHAAARAVVDRHREQFPQAIEQMRQLPGIGKYTAHAVASFAFNRSVPIVEANTARVLARLFNVRLPIDSAAGRERLWQHAARLVPKRGAADFNSALVDLGALICLPRQPRCGICPVKKFCHARNPETLPIKKKRPCRKSLVESHAFIVRQNKILLQQADRRWRGMWILPRLKLDCLKRSSFPCRPILTSIFPFTHHRVTLRVFRRRACKIDNRSQRWLSIRRINSIPIPSPHRRALQALLSSDSVSAS